MSHDSKSGRKLSAADEFLQGWLEGNDDASWKELSHDPLAEKEASTTGINETGAKDAKEGVAVHVHAQDDTRKERRESIGSGSGRKRRDSGDSRVSLGADRTTSSAVPEGTGFDAWARKRREALAAKRETTPQKPAVAHEKEEEKKKLGVEEEKSSETDEEKQSSISSHEETRQHIQHTEEKPPRRILDHTMPRSRSESFDQRALLVHQMELTLQKVREYGVRVFGIPVKPGHPNNQVVPAAPMIIPYPMIPEGAKLYVYLRSKSGAVLPVEIVPSILVQDQQRLLMQPPHPYPIHFPHHPVPLPYPPHMMPAPMIE
eukprot:TRINITY_DN28645_c0_g1_i1.p1 TRINITY_DN28645_c0_g1~~TRINITY_DN28645_c0_g1_i1.p1  ORF type:complete len:317 (+),score=73.45 TRINITY_DN28645_c0_g1_i1:114-1064(+)